MKRSKGYPNKYLITGITGFAGTHLANLLYEEGHEISGLVRGSNGMESDVLDTVSAECFQSINFLYGNLEDYQSLEKILDENEFDGIFHLAAQSLPTASLLFPLDTFRTNIMGTANLIDVVAKYQPNCKLMFCSTSEVYGNSGSDGRLIKETEPLAPSNPYGVSKSSSDLYMQERMVNKKIKGFITRAFSHTGIRRGRNFSISSDAYQIARIMKKQQPPILEVGNLSTIRVVIDVRDTVRAYYDLMMNEKSNGEVFNVCGDTPRPMSFFTDYLIKLSGLDIIKSISEKYYRPIDIQYQHGDTTKLKSLTGWEAKIPIEQTLEDLLNYWLKKIN